jgi:hypothetical protein
VFARAVTRERDAQALNPIPTMKGVVLPSALSELVMVCTCSCFMHVAACALRVQARSDGGSVHLAVAPPDRMFRIACNSLIWMALCFLQHSPISRWWVLSIA